MIEGDINPSARLDLSFGPTEFLLAGDFIYNTSAAVINDRELEGVEGFILYFELDRDEIDPDDYRRLEAGSRTILVTIRDDDSKLPNAF